MMNLLEPLIPTYSFLFIALSTLLFVLLSFMVIYSRFKENVAYGIGIDPKSGLAKMARVHGNFAEYAPIYLLELMALEIAGTEKIWIWILGSSFLLSRLLHWKGMFHRKTPNPFRASGMMLTFGGLIVMSLRLCWIVFR
jgi:uncharacterized membrane protein YecN with MAPEG domain